MGVAVGFCFERDMGRKAANLNARAVSRIDEPGMHAVGTVPGLDLQVLESGARSWFLRAVIGGKRRDMSLGGYPGVTLAQAWDKARKARDKIEEGVVPWSSRSCARRARARSAGRCGPKSICAKRSGPCRPLG